MDRLEIRNINTDLLRDVIVVRKLPRPHRARADIAHLTRLDKVVKSLHGLLCGDVIQVGTMDLEEVDVGCPKTLEGGVDLVEDGLTREPILVDVISRVPKLRLGGREDVLIVGHEVEALCEDDDAMTRNVELTRKKRVSGDEQ